LGLASGAQAMDESLLLMKDMFSAWIFKLGVRQRNPGLFNQTNLLLKTDFSSKQELREIQEKKLRTLFDFHRRHSVYYQKILPKNITNPFQTLEALPIITKSDLTTYVNSMQCYTHVKKSFSAETSGTSGTPFLFKKDLTWDTAHRASIFRGYNWFDVRPWDRNGYFWGFNFDPMAKKKTQLLDHLQNRFRIFSYREKELLSFLEKMQSAVFIHGYSSMIFQVAKLAINLGYSPEQFPKLKMIKGTSEKIYDYYQPVVLEAFGRKMISEYGSAEGGIHAFECPSGQMHVNMENIILEEVDGAAVVTNLNAFSLPIYRYKIGDAILLDRNSICSCGRQSDIVTEVLGRVGQTIYGMRSQYPSLTLYYIFKNLAQNHGYTIPYQGYQKEKGHLTIRTDGELASGIIELIEEQCIRYFSKDMVIQFETMPDNQIRSGKLKDFVSQID
jgi:phenylacetate-CoA ligase